MRVGLKLDQQLVINMIHIMDVVTVDNILYINMMNGFTYIVIREADFENWRTDDENPDNIDHIVITADEYHRIQKALSEYLGVDAVDSPAE